MSSRPPPFVARLRRELLQRPGITARPVCPWCGQERAAEQFGAEACKPCEAERAAMSEMWAAERWAEANGGPIAQHPPMFGDPAADEPFLPGDEEGDV